MVKKTNERSSDHSGLPRGRRVFPGLFRERKKARFSAGALFLAATLVLTLFTAVPLRADAKTAERLFPRVVALGGEPFGVRFVTDGAVVYRVLEGSAAQRAGVQRGDVLLSMDNQKITNAADVRNCFEKAKGKSVPLWIRRDGKKLKLRLKAEKSDEHLGVYFRNALSGIGTISFYDPESGVFAGLGHGVCDSESGVLLPLSEATISQVRLTGVVRGEKGAPGQLRGVFYPGRTGTVIKNCKEGVYGRFDRIPDERERICTASAAEVREGEAEICCTVAGERPERYRIEIERVLKPGTDGKDFLIRVTDEKLLALTGGIVQGMSGSPILQNGKLAGVVTHVLVGEPAQGYAIAVEKMIAAIDRGGI